jgi:ATP-dependent DNA helicase DinG
MPSARFRPRAAKTLRDAIRQAGGVEVFAIGDVDDQGLVSALEIHCRGTQDAVPALMLRPRAGQVVIHNHPSGVLRPSDADFALANRYGDEGVGVVITDSAVERDFWVVEPARRVVKRVDRDRLRAFFERDLVAALPDCEHRPGQLELALAIADRLDDGGVLIAEAGTGTGKSLAYLVPAVLWALANDAKVAVSTFTRTLQSQLLTSDLPLMRRGGLEFEAALLKGRGNYLCRRKLLAAQQDPGADGPVLERIAAWAERSEEGSIQDLSEDLDSELWDRVESDSDQTLRARCPHYNTCFYYQARRRAAASHLLILNHALLVADLRIKQESGDGVVPRYGRLILDEGHHLQSAATGAVSERVTALGIRRAISPLLPRKRRPGALHRVAERFGTDENKLVDQCTQATHELGLLRDSLDPTLEHVAAELLQDTPQRRVVPAMRGAPEWLETRRVLFDLGKSLRRAHDRLGALLASLDEVEIPTDQAQPLLDLTRAERRLKAHLQSLRSFLSEPKSEDEAWCRWVERGRRDAVALSQAPVDVAPLLQDLLFDRMDALAITSATLTVAGRFDHYLDQVGLSVTDPEREPPHLLRLDSPFDYARQAMLVLPKDLPDPREDGWLDAVGQATIKLVRASEGGAFVLCTSHATVRQLSATLRRELGHALPVLEQGKGSRERLLRRFKETEGAVLVGTDSFWEGVSVKGRALRLVIIPRLPFRVPTEPVSQARYERVESQGRNPFRVYSLPEAVLKLRQGFGRLVRGQDDRGAVAILDRRVHQMWYGRVFLNSLPPATRAVGPQRALLPRLEQFFQELDQAGLSSHHEHQGPR